jgi:hypothetical protein
MSRRKFVQPTDEKSISHRDKTEIELLREEIQGLKKAQGILLLSHHPSVDGFVLVRCRCRKFATRHFAIVHPMAGRHDQWVCDGCKVEHPVAINHLSKIEQLTFANPKIIEVARSLNSQIEEMFK